jgi:hypothetical protein
MDVDDLIPREHGVVQVTVVRGIVPQPEAVGGDSDEGRSTHASEQEPADGGANHEDDDRPEEPDVFVTSAKSRDNVEATFRRLASRVVERAFR